MEERAYQLILLVREAGREDGQNLGDGRIGAKRVDVSERGVLRLGGGGDRVDYLASGGEGSRGRERCRSVGKVRSRILEDEGGKGSRKRLGVVDESVEQHAIGRAAGLSALALSARATHANKKGE